MLCLYGDITTMTLIRIQNYMIYFTHIYSDRNKIIVIIDHNNKSACNYNYYIANDEMVAYDDYETIPDEILNKIRNVIDNYLYLINVGKIENISTNKQNNT